MHDVLLACPPSSFIAPLLGLRERLAGVFLNVIAIRDRDQNNRS
jgi:hypothetical protein